MIISIDLPVNESTRYNHYFNVCYESQAMLDSKGGNNYISIDLWMICFFVTGVCIIYNPDATNDQKDG